MRILDFPVIIGNFVIIRSHTRKGMVLEAMQSISKGKAAYTIISFASGEMLCLKS
jgi:hypothetical protein